MEDMSGLSFSKKNVLSLQMFILGFFVIALDQVTKWIIHRHFSVSLGVGGGWVVFKNFLGIDFSLQQVHNSGAAWGVLDKFPLSLVMMRIVLISSLFLYLIRYNTQKKWRIPLVLIIAGAFSNVMDFFFYGYVIDMFHFVFWGYDFPVFNVADSAICIGVALLFYYSWDRSLLKENR